MIDSNGKLIIDNGRVGIEYETLIENNQWTSIGIATDSQDLRNLAIYVNGRLVDSGGKVVASGSDLNYGLRQEANSIWSPYFQNTQNGSLFFLDEYRFYSRRLSDIEIKALYDYELKPSQLTYSWQYITTANFTWDEAYNDSVAKGYTMATWSTQDELNSLINFVLSNQKGGWVNLVWQGAWKYHLLAHW